QAEFLPPSSGASTPAPRPSRVPPLTSSTLAGAADEAPAGLDRPLRLGPGISGICGKLSDAAPSCAQMAALSMKGGLRLKLGENVISRLAPPARPLAADVRIDLADLLCLAVSDPPAEQRMPLEYRHPSVRSEVAGQPEFDGGIITVTTENEEVWFQNRRSKERRMKQLSTLGARRHFFRSPRRVMRALRPGMSPDPLDDSPPDLLAQPPGGPGGGPQNAFGYFSDRHHRHRSEVVDVIASFTQRRALNLPACDSARAASSSSELRRSSKPHLKYRNCPIIRSVPSRPKMSEIVRRVSSKANGFCRHRHGASASIGTSSPTPQRSASGAPLERAPYPCFCVFVLQNADQSCHAPDAASGKTIKAIAVIIVQSVCVALIRGAIAFTVFLYGRIAEWLLTTFTSHTKHVGPRPTASMPS
ncbi:hypothetical protein BIW11_04477, partial [Tropilaelaps mercedesae]